MAKAAGVFTLIACCLLAGLIPVTAHRPQKQMFPVTGALSVRPLRATTPPPTARAHCPPTYVAGFVAYGSLKGFVA